MFACFKSEFSSVVFFDCTHSAVLPETAMYKWGVFGANHSDFVIFPSLSWRTFTSCSSKIHYVQYVSKMEERGGKCISVFPTILSIKSNENKKSHSLFLAIVGLVKFSTLQNTLSPRDPNPIEFKLMGTLQQMNLKWDFWTLKMDIILFLLFNFILSFMWN